MPNKDEPKKPEEEKKTEEKPTPKDNLVESRHSLAIGGRELKYTVTAGTMVMKEETADREKESVARSPGQRSSSSPTQKTV